MELGRNRNIEHDDEEDVLIDQVDLQSGPTAPGHYDRPRFDYPTVKENWTENGYLFGNQNGRSIYNMIIEGATGVLFMLVLVISLAKFHREDTKISWS